MAAARSTAKPVARILLAYPAQEEHAIDALATRYSKNIVQLDRIGIRSSADLDSQMTEVRRILEDVAGIVFFSRDLDNTREHLEWLKRIGFAATRTLPRIFVHYPGLIDSSEEKKLKTRLLYRHTDLSISRKYPRLTFMLRDGLAPIVAKVRGVSVQSAKNSLSSRPKSTKSKLPA